MAIQIAPTLVFTTFPATSTENIANGINNNLVAVNWTSTKLFGQATFTFPSLPADGQTFTIAGTTYTYKTVINNAIANQITIAANATQQATFTADAINSVTGGGSEWSTPTVANPLCSATTSGTEVIFTALAGGMDANSRFSLTGVAGIFNTTLWSNGRGFFIVNVQTPQGLQGALWVRDLRGSLQNQVHIWWGTADATLQSATFTLDGSSNASLIGTFTSLIVAGGRNLTIQAVDYQFFVWLAADAATRGCQVGMSTPYLRAGQAPVGINGVTNSAGLFQIQTSAAHGLTTGQTVFLSGIAGNPTANGTWVVTVIDATHYTLNGSTFAGSYSGGGLQGGVGGSGQPGGLSRCILGWGDNDGVSYQNTWRNNPASPRLGWLCANDNSYGTGTGVVSTTTLELVYSRRRGGGLFYGWGGLSNSQEARVGWPGTAAAAQFLEMGQLWNALTINDTIPMDRTNSGYLGHNWINQTNLDSECSLWITTS